MAKQKTKTCACCSKNRRLVYFFSSNSFLHQDGKYYICKDCVKDIVISKNENDQETYDLTKLKIILREMDKPFLEDQWQLALEHKKETVGSYMSLLSLPQNNQYTWKDSTHLQDKNNDEDDTNNDNKSNKKEIQRLQQKWGYNFKEHELIEFERKYNSLTKNGTYPVRTALHKEALMTYCMYKVQAEFATAQGDVKTAKDWGSLAQKQGEIAKINLNKLDDSDLTQGLDGFSQLVLAVEKVIDIIPILPRFIKQPNDAIDFAISCYIYYERKLNNLDPVDYSDIYDFYQKQIKDYAKLNPEFAKLLREEEFITSKGQKKKILVFDVETRIKELQKKDPNNPFYTHLQKWVDFVSWGRWYPDLWYDMITPETGGIRLDADQRILMRCLARFTSVMGVFSRGYGKTMIHLMTGHHAGIFYPYLKLVMTAQTEKNASRLVQEKYDEVITFYPLLEHEIKDFSPSTETTKITYQSGAFLDTVATNDSSKGIRRHRMTVEESAQVSKKKFEDALEPVVNVARRTIGKLSYPLSPYELNGQINRFTTSWYRGTDEFEESVSMYKRMIQLDGVIALGASWKLPNKFGRGESTAKILNKKKTISPTAFALNYGSEWVGVTNGALVSINKLMNLRTLVKAELKGIKDGEYIVSVDVARSQSRANNQCSVAILKIKRNSEGRITSIHLINIINIPSTLNFQEQAQEIMKIKNLYNAKAVVVDANGVGVGLVDNLVLEQIDPQTGESLGCWKTMNTDQESELDDAEEVLYVLKAQAINHFIIVNFIDMVESGKLKLLEKRADTSHEMEDQDYLHNETLPYLQTDLLLEEIANLRLRVLDTKKLTVDQQTRKINKDRYSALAYGLWYINEFEDNVYNSNKDYDITEFLLIN